jgi:hypothetical protein
MQIKCHFVWDGKVLVPSETDANTVEAVRKLKVGDRLLVSLHRPRNPEHHRMAFAVFNRIADAVGKTVDTIYNEIKFLTGRFDWMKITDKNGRERAAVVLQSISFESMGQDEFQRYWNEAWPVIVERYFPDVPEKSIREIMDIVSLPEDL